MGETELQQICIRPGASIHDAITAIDRGAQGIALVVDEEMRLLGTVSDGDIRRAILDAVDLDMPAQVLLARKADSLYPKPVTAPLGTQRDALLQLMQERKLRHIPLLDEAGRVEDLATMDEMLPDQVLPLQAVIMAGGFGTRLRPLTEELPKPMLPVDGRPLMERTIRQLRQVGIRHVNVTTHYRPEKIIEHFGDGRAFDVKLSYVHEDEPLGTAGALGLIHASQEPILVINGDILTRVDFRAMLMFHQENKADMTVAVRQFSLQVPYGVVECEGSRIRSLSEKPQLSCFINAGIYLLEPAVCRHIPNGQPFNMTDLMQRLLDDEWAVVSFPIHEYWLDIGQPDDYEQAQEHASLEGLKP